MRTTDERCKNCGLLDHSGFDKTRASKMIAFGWLNRGDSVLNTCLGFQNTGMKSQLGESLVATSTI